MNHLSSSTVFIGQRILLRSDDNSDVITSSEVVSNAKNNTNTSSNTATQSAVPYHTVKQGENLFGISRKYKLSIKKLKKYNNLFSNDIKIDQKLYLEPVAKHLLTSAKDIVVLQPNKIVEAKVKENSIVKEEIAEIPEVAEKEEITVIDKVVEDAVEDTVEKIVEDTEVEVIAAKKEKSTKYLPMKSIPKNEIPPDFHTVKKGETLYAIAYKYNLEIPMFRKINGLKTDNISEGQQLRLKKGALLPKTEEREIGKKEQENRNTHTVVKGDTLYSIATRNLLTLAKLKQLNHLKSNTITIGQVLILN